MSAIVGHLGLDSSGHERTRAMLGACEARASHQPQIQDLAKPGDAFGYAGFAATSHSEREPRPFVHQPSGVVITADIRLDNRHELHQQLVGSDRSAGDAELALLAYLKWERSFPEHLIGDFAIALFDPRSHTVLLTRDHLGVRPLIYASDANSIVFGSSVAAIHAGSDRTFGINIERLQHVMLDPLEVAAPNMTFFQGIERVPAAGLLVWSPGSQPHVHAYWKPERGKPLELASDQDYQDAYRELFETTVTCRLESPRPVAAMLSGGLDSSSVVALAQAMSSSPLRTYSFVEATPQKGSDTPHIRACAAAMNLDPVMFTEHEIASGYDLDEIVSDPDSAFDTEMGALWSTARNMNETGYGVVLTGIGGDETVALNPRHNARDLINAGRKMRAIREMVRDDGRWQPHAFARFVGVELAPAAIADRLRAARGPSLAYFDDEMVAVGIDPSSEAGQRLKRLRVELTTRPEWNTGDHRLKPLTGPWLTVGLERYDRVAARHGVEARHPMCDKRMVEFCLSLPGEQLQRNSWSKWILRKAFAGTMPDSVLWRPKEFVGVGPASNLVGKIHGPKTSVVPPTPELFGDLGPLTDRTDAGTQWERHVVSTWWRHHGPRTA